MACTIDSIGSFDRKVSPLANSIVLVAASAGCLSACRPSTIIISFPTRAIKILKGVNRADRQTVLRWGNNLGIFSRSHLLAYECAIKKWCGRFLRTFLCVRVHHHRPPSSSAFLFRQGPAISISTYTPWNDHSIHCKTTR